MSSNQGASVPDRAFAATAVEPVSRLDPNGLQSLALFCEQVAGDDAELEREIAYAVYGPVCAGLPRNVPRQEGWAFPRYTTSIDAAMTLVPRDWHWSLYDTNGVYKANAQVEPPKYSSSPFNSDGATPALALCGAALKARAAIAIEARRAETAKHGSVADESAVLKGCAQ